MVVTQKLPVSALPKVVSRPEFAKDHESGLRSDQGPVVLYDFSKFRFCKSPYDFLNLYGRFCAYNSDSVGRLGPTQAPETGPDGAQTFLWASFPECAPSIRPTAPTTTHILPRHTLARRRLPRRGHATAPVGTDAASENC